MPCFLDLITPQIHDVGDQVTRNWIGPQRILYDHELLFVREGECETHFPDETICNAANSFIIKPCGLPHSANQTSSGKIHFSWIHFDWSYQEPTLTEQSFLPCYAPRPPPGRSSPPGTRLYSSWHPAWRGRLTVHRIPPLCLSLRAMESWHRQGTVDLSATLDGNPG